MCTKAAEEAIPKFSIKNPPITWLVAVLSVK